MARHFTIDEIFFTERNGLGGTKFARMFRFALLCGVVARADFRPSESLPRTGRPCGYRATQHFLERVEEKLTAFSELERVTRESLPFRNAE
jgi:hypothetical protein